MEEKIRLQKIISQSGFCSRRKAEEYIKQGKVKIDGRIADLGMKIDPHKHNISVDGQSIGLKNKQKLIYLALHKPRGYVTSMSDQFDRKDISDLTKNIKERLFPVGRLDMDSEGLLLLTNDGNFANMITHPKYEIEKTYRVTTSPHVDTKILYSLAQGVFIDGEKTKPAYIEIDVEDKQRTVLFITIKEGRNRQIRKMMESVNLPVKRLKRTEIGGIKLGMLQPGKYRELDNKEVKILLNQANNNYQRNL